MRKGRGHIAIGGILICFQLMAMSSGNVPGIHVGGSTELIAYEIAACLGYYGPGICGLVLLCLGLKAYCSDDKTVVEESVNAIPAPEPEKAPGSIVPDAPVPVFVDLTIPEAPPAPKKSKQRFCKYCGGAIDTESRKCTKCGKQYFLFKIKKTTVWAIFTVLIIADLAALNVFQYLQYQNEMDHLQETISVLEVKAGYFDDVIKVLRSDRIGFSSSSFKASKHVIAVREDEEGRIFTLTAHDLSEKDVTISYSSDAATVSFNSDSWNKNVNMTVEPRHEGITVVTFENDKNSKSFKIIIIVTE